MFTIRIRIFSSSFEFSNSPFLLCNTLGVLPRNALSKELRHFVVFVDRAHSSSSCKGLSQLQELTGYLAGGSWVKRTKSRLDPTLACVEVTAWHVPCRVKATGKFHFVLKTTGQSHDVSKTTGQSQAVLRNYRTISCRVRNYIQDNLSCRVRNFGQCHVWNYTTISCCVRNYGTISCRVRNYIQDNHSSSVRTFPIKIFFLYRLNSFQLIPV